MATNRYMPPLDGGGLELDTAIIGAGVSGLYSGWRLLTGGPAQPTGEGPRPTTAIFEGGRRIGGRLFSVTDMPGLPNVVGELGGMRYMEHQGIVNGLVQHFGLQPADFPMGDESANLFYLRGQRFKGRQWREAGFRTRYWINEGDVGQHPDDLFEKVVAHVLQANGAQRPADRAGWDAIKPWLRYDRGPDRQLRLEEMGFWNLLLDFFGSEGYDLLSEAGGYHSNTINWNAAEALPYVVGDFGGAVKYKTLQGGFDTIAHALADRYRAAGGTIYGCSRLVRFDRAEGGPRRYRLVIRNADTGVSHVVHADHVVLAMPRRSLELLDQDTFFFGDPAVIHNVRSVIGEPSFKLLMGFYEEGQTEPWWTRHLGLTSGRSITDLPMRQCYYFGTDPETHHSLMLASYNDMSTVDFWKPLEVPDQGRKGLHDLVAGAAREERYRPTPTPAASLEELLSAEYPRAPWRLVDHSLVQLQAVHGIDIPKPYTTAFTNWNDDPYGGGYHAWKARYPVGETMAFMRQPVPGERVHVCGEAYSDQQGWIEGAFCVAELMLQRHFNLQWPREWLSESYYLGRDPDPPREPLAAVAVARAPLRSAGDA